MPRPSPSKQKPASCAKQRGLSLIELVMFIAIVGISLAGVLVVYNNAVKGSADPMLRKQAVAVAESLLHEVLMQPFTWCDPQDAANDTDPPPASGAACTGGSGNSQDKGGGLLGPQPATESRVSATDPFDNVADYNGLSMGAGITAIDGTPVPALGDFAASVSVRRDGGTFSLPADAVLRVDVLVTGRGQSITLTGWRFRHSPQATG
jgi:MSHA pilin protein MshD